MKALEDVAAVFVAYLDYYLIKWFVPRQTEMSMYVFSLSLIITILLNHQVHVYFADTDTGGIPFYFLSILCCIFALTPVFKEHKITSENPLYETVFFYGSVSMGLAYAWYWYAVGSMTGAILGWYHLLFAFFIFFRSSSPYFSQALAVRSYNTPTSKIILGTILVVSVFAAFYLQPQNTFMWAFPVSTALLLWSGFEVFFDIFWPQK